MPLPPVAAPGNARFAVQVWNMAGGMDWAGLETVAEVVGVPDVDLEQLVCDLVTIRDFNDG